MKTVIVATDYSSAAANAVNYAADMAIAINADLLLLYIYQPPIVYSEVPVPIDIDVLQRNAESDMNKCSEQLSERIKSNLKISTEVRMGVFFQELKSVCESIYPYAVVMGSQGTTATERFLFGSHTIHTMKHLEWPLITVSPSSTFSAIKKIGLACDFAKVVTTTPIHEIKTLVTHFNAELHVINTGSKDDYNPDVAFGSVMLKSMLGKIKPHVHFIYNENTDDAIINFAEKNHIDLLVVLPKRHGIMEKLAHKSHTKQMILHCHVPVMAIHNVEK